MWGLTLEFKDSLVCAASGCSCLYPSGVYLRSSSTHTHTHTHFSVTLCAETRHLQFHADKRKKENLVWSLYSPIIILQHTHTLCPEAHSMSCNPASHSSGLITLLAACDPRERLSRVSRPLPLAGGHRDGSTHPFITLTLGRETPGMGMRGRIRVKKRERVEMKVRERWREEGSRKSQVPSDRGPD